MKASEMTTVDDDLLKMAGDLDRLRAKLQVAEDALDSAWMYADKLPHWWPLPKMVRDRMKDALDAIRGEEIHTCPHCGRKVAVGHLLGDCKGRKGE